MKLFDAKKRAPLNLGRVLVLGLGKSGRAAATYCADRLGDRVEVLAIAAGKPNDASREFAAQMEQAGALAMFEDAAVAELAARVREERGIGEDVPAFDLCIASPGISEFSDLYLSAAAVSAEVVSEVEFAWRESQKDSTWVAITGTNGKTTVTALCAHVLAQTGFKAKAVGNIGDTCLDAVAAGDTDVYVAEISSYQMASTRQFAPNAAIMLNITPDHLHWHRSLDAYRDAKYKVFDNMHTVPGAVAVLDATNDVVRGKVREFKQAGTELGFGYIPMGTAQGIHSDMRAACGAENAAFLADDETLTVAFAGTETRLLKASELLIEGEHNAGNALAVASAALALGAEPEALRTALATFKPLEHRIEPCGQVNGVSCYNDSKATNVDATLKALAAFPSTRPLVLLGGDDKGTDLAPLVQAAYANTRAAVCYGEAADRFLEAFEAEKDQAPADYLLLRGDHMRDSFDLLLEQAQPGEVILLSPACASFDEFNSFEERGTVFKQLVADRASQSR